MVQEALDETVAAKEAGLLVSKEINPFGEDLQSLVMFAFGDVHQLGSNPENSIYHRNKFPYKYIEALAFQPKKHLIESMIIGFLGRDYEALIDEINTKKGVKSFAKRKLLDGLGEERVMSLMEDHEDWSLEKKPKMQVDALRVTMGSILQRIREKVREPEMRTPHVLVDFGDRGDTESNMGDIALTTLELIGSAQQVAGASEDKFQTMIAMLSGNHDADINNHSFESELFQRELFGRPIFLQYVGGYAVLAINTNFYSSFWRYHVSLERQKFSQLQEKRESVQEIVDPRVDEQIKRYADFFERIESEEKRQNELIQEALQSGKKIAVLAHEEAQVIKHLPLENSRITHIFAGHLHKPVDRDLKQKNKDGQNIRLMRVGTASATDTGIVWPKSYEISITGDNLEVQDLEIDQTSVDKPEYY